MKTYEHHKERPVWDETPAVYLQECMRAAGYKLEHSCYDSHGGRSTVECYYPELLVGKMEARVVLPNVEAVRKPSPARTTQVEGAVQYDRGCTPLFDSVRPKPARQFRRGS